MTDFLRTRTGVIVAVLVVLLVAALGVGGYFLVSGSSDSASAPAATAEVPEGMISVEDAPELPPADQARPAQAAPEAPVAQVFLSEPCGAAATDLRALMSEVPSGLALDEAGNARLNAGLPAMSSACSPEEVAAFQAQELLPWMNYALAAS
jgi:hypothetical protein